MAGERPAPHEQSFKSVVIVVNNPEFSDPVAQGLLRKAQKSGFPVRGVIVGKRTEIVHQAPTIREAVITATDVAEKLLANPVSEVVKKVSTEVVDSLTPKNQK